MTQSGEVLEADWLVNRAGGASLSDRLTELWHNRRLIPILAQRDIRARFKQTVLGVFWAALQPLASALVFMLVFGEIAGLGQDQNSYFLFAFSGSLIWTYFSAAFSRIVASVVANRQLVSKVYFPRLAIPMAAALVPVLDLFIGLAILTVLLLVQQTVPTFAILLAPVWLLGIFTLCIGIGSAFGALNVRYRDLGPVAGYIVQLLLFLTPVAYPASELQGRLSVFEYANPVASMIIGFRWSVGLEPAPPENVWVSVLLILMVAWFGLRYFLASESRFADHI